MKTVYLYGEVGYEISAKQLVEDLKEIEPEDELTVAISSPGGSVFEAQAIIAVLRNRGQFTTRVDGIAASAASVIAAAGNQRLISRGSMLMIHHASFYAFGNSKEFRELADLLDKVEESTIIPIYLEAVGDKLSKEQLIEMMDAESYISDVEAVELGFATGLADNAPQNCLTKMPDKFLNIYKKIPEALKKQQEPVSKIVEEDLVELEIVKVKPNLSTYEARLRYLGL